MLRKDIRNFEKFYLTFFFFSQMVAAFVGHSGRALRRPMDTEGEVLGTLRRVHHDMPDEFRPTLRRTRAQEQTEPP